ncbi:DNA repair protein, partial [Klebsiella oxytoca]
LKSALSVPEKLDKIVRDFAAPRYKEGYEKGIHDHDAIAILKKLIPVGESADLLRYNPTARAIAAIFWEQAQTNAYPALWPERARTAMNIQQLFHNDGALLDLQAEIEADISLFLQKHPIACEGYQQTQAAEYLSFALARSPIDLIYSKYARDLVSALQSRLEDALMWIDFNRSQQNLSDRYAQRWALIQNWLQGLCSIAEFAHLTPYIPGAIAIIILDKAASARYS